MRARPKPCHSRPRVPCLDCRKMTRNGPRCRDCSAGHLRGAHRAELNSPEMRRLRPLVKAGVFGGCRVCGTFEDLTIAHDVARILGGTLADGWHVECRSCNSRSGAKATAQAMKSGADINGAGSRGVGQ